jgi:hypothetical protein
LKFLLLPALAANVMLNFTPAMFCVLVQTDPHLAHTCITALASQTWDLVRRAVLHHTDHPAELPSYIGRALTFSYFLEILRLPALADFTRALMKAFFGGDASEWERALLMPHYNAAGMPSCSLHQVRSAC